MDCRLHHNNYRHYFACVVIVKRQSMDLLYSYGTVGLTHYMMQWRSYRVCRVCNAWGPSEVGGPTDEMEKKIIKFILVCFTGHTSLVTLAAMPPQRTIS